MSIKGTRTEQNLLKAFAGESQARNKYTYFSEVAKEEGYEQISAIFIETAENEREHAKREFNSSRVSVIPLPTFKRLPTARITNGLICIPEWRR